MKLEKLKDKMVAALAKSNKEMIESMDEETKKYFKPHNYDRGFFFRDDHLYCSAEHGHDTCDYYGEYRGGCPWVNPILEKLAEDNGYFWEWENAACMVLCRI